jgi:hypothetical protein
LDRHVKKYALK